jgi:hypothetical protein
MRRMFLCFVDLFLASSAFAQARPHGASAAPHALDLGTDQADNVALAPPTPIRVGPDDVVGVARATSTCAILARIGIEYRK